MARSNYLIDDSGRRLNAQVRMNLRGWNGFRLRVLPVPGEGMEAQFGEALDLSLQRFSDLGLLIVDALVMNAPNRRVPPAQRRLMVWDQTYPILAQRGEATSEIAFWLHYRAKQIAREKFGPESAVPRVALDMHIRLPRFELDSLVWLQQELKRAEAASQVVQSDAVEPSVIAPAVDVVSAASEPTVSGDSGSRGQGRLQDAEQRSLIDAYAMQRAIAHFGAQGWQVLDVSAFESFDLRCTRDGRELHVEVKGSTTPARSILLTRNEVQHARSYADTALFVVSHIEVVFAHGSRVACGGNVRLYMPWKIKAEDLEAQTYSLALREDRSPR